MPQQINSRAGSARVYSRAMHVPEVGNFAFAVGISLVAGMSCWYARAMLRRERVRRLTRQRIFSVVRMGGNAHAPRAAGPI